MSGAEDPRKHCRALGEKTLDIASGELGRIVALILGVDRSGHHFNFWMFFAAHQGYFDVDADGLEQQPIELAAALLQCKLDHISAEWSS